MYGILPCFPHFLSSFTKSEKKINTFNNSMKLTNFCLVKIHSAVYHIILEACFFPMHSNGDLHFLCSNQHHQHKKKNLLPI